MFYTGFYLFQEEEVHNFIFFLEYQEIYLYQEYTLHIYRL